MKRVLTAPKTGATASTISILSDDLRELPALSMMVTVFMPSEKSCAMTAIATTSPA
jgi:hypothetical protein